MAAMLCARIKRKLAAQGNSNMSKSGMNLSGQKSPATPNARHISTNRHTPKLFMTIPMNECIVLNRDASLEGNYERHPLPETGIPIRAHLVHLPGARKTRSAIACSMRNGV
jgi:hypothetical protein